MTAVTATSEITFLVPSESALRAVILTRHRGIRRVGQLRCYRRIDNITFSWYSIFRIQFSGRWLRPMALIRCANCKLCISAITVEIRFHRARVLISNLTTLRLEEQRNLECYVPSRFQNCFFQSVKIKLGDHDLMILKTRENWKTPIIEVISYD